MNANEPTLLHKLRSPLGAFERSDAVSLVRAQGLCDQAARAIEDATADNKRLRDELTAVTLERDELKRLSKAAPDMYALCKELLDWVHGKRSGRCLTDEMTQRLVTAIDKAEGRL